MTTPEEKKVCAWATTSPDGKPFCGKLCMPITIECAQCAENPAHEEEVSALQIDVQTTITLAESLGVAPNRYGELLAICDGLVKLQVDPKATYEEAMNLFNTKLFVAVGALPPKEAAVLGALVVLALKQIYLNVHKTHVQPEVQIKMITPEEYEKMTGHKIDEQPESDEDEDKVMYTPQGNEGWLDKGEDRDVA